MIKRTPLPFNIKYEDYNNNNLHEYAPYIIRDDKIIIDQSWFSSLTSYIQRIIRTRLKEEFQLELLQIPHEYQPTHPKLSTVYQAYIDGFDYHVWYSPYIPNGPQQVKLIHLSDMTKKVLLDIYEKKRPNYDKNLEKLHKKLRKHMMPNTEYFIRLSSTSGKNEKAVKPFTKPTDIIDHITSVKQFVVQEYSRDKDTYLVLIPWMDINNFDTNYEFRIFVHNRKLTAASPQKYWELRQFSQEELEVIEEALLNIPFINYSPYDSFVADVYVDVNTRKCHLIEFNPFGPASGAGASLFNWREDYDQLHSNKNVTELRYLSAISY